MSVLLILSAAFTVPFTLINHVLLQLCPWLTKVERPPQRVRQGDYALIFGMTITMVATYTSFYSTYMTDGSFADWVKRVLLSECAFACLVGSSLVWKDLQRFTPPFRRAILISFGMILYGWIIGVTVVLSNLLLSRCGEFLPTLHAATILASGQTLVMCSQLILTTGSYLLTGLCVVWWTAVLLSVVLFIGALARQKSGLAVVSAISILCLWVIHIVLLYVLI
jgi:hypothetical protein